MKQGIHPIWYNDAKVTCVCGNTFTIGSTIPGIRVEICSNCHPFFTGQQKFVDTLGQVERFTKKTQVAETKKEIKKQILQSRAEKTAPKADKPTLKDLLMQARKDLHS